LEIIDAALRQTVISHHGKYWRFDNLRLTPRPLQQPFPPVWLTVVSTASARKAAQRGAKITTGFHPTAKVKEIFDAYRDEAARLGRPAGPDQLGIRRQVVIALSESAARDALAHRKEHVHQLLKADPRVPQPGRQVLDTPTAHTFTIGDEEFIAGTPASVTEQIIGECRELGAGHFLALFEHDMGGTLARSWELLGTEVNPVLRRATL
jgi:alkanesulfonate monooxygenase SsuD/methylene tetrahydromethanopterin reductase-like flavin-dependent oxidoreductase (luciferase family)